jgi:hypothetical protein
MVHCTAPAGEETQPRPATLDPVRDDLTLSQLKAVMRAFDETLADARRLRAGLVAGCVRDE